MSYCNRNGECLMKCDCKCYSEECICEHREHNGYCPTNCCSIVKCRNISCKSMKPKWIFDFHNGMCVKCDLKFTKYKYTKIIADCPICLINENIILLECKHKMCEYCWNEMCKKGFNEHEEEFNTLCLLCKNNTQDIKYTI